MRWNALHLSLALLALFSGIDDALETFIGVVDFFHLDTHHGVISLALLSLSKSLKDALDDFSGVRENLKKDKNSSR